VQRPRPPVILGGWGTKRTPAPRGPLSPTKFNHPSATAFAPVSYFREGCDHVRRACEAIGRDPGTMRFTAAVLVAVGPRRRGVPARAEASGQDPIKRVPTR